ncbi:polysaccharide deacetylase family protein [Allorhizocola rhizosphaerae]|uniref:polysaccharide deacetylase family protein n=1 Tax=Allorhizocola rhizosphaerae TaxID=1872709 RepID=UPI000E3C99CD|nr:polysaccharide deacetylase family protein [Allorhizocola rhizosphaerae]
MRVPFAIASAILAILSIGYLFGASTKEDQPAPVPAAAKPSTVAPLPMPEIETEAEPDVFPLARLNPITGPDRPPLPDDEHGPHGSRRTTGTYEVALTFDDGPDPRWTPEVLDLLRQHRVKATFCVVGMMVQEFPHLVREIASEGHTLCNHSWGHDTRLGTRAYSAILDDMKRTNDAIRAAAPGTRVSYFRHPGGAWTDTAVGAARSLGMSSLHWTVDPRDWGRPGARAIAAEVNQSTIPGAIVLLHDGGGDRRGTTEALRSILPNLAARYPLVALPPGVDPPRRHGFDLPIHLGQR